MKPWLNDTFFQMPQSLHHTSEGDVALPILYFDTSCLLAFFLSPLRCVREKLQDTGFSPALTVGDRAIVGTAFYQYRETSIGSYNEVGVAIPVLPESYTPPRSSWLDLLTSSQHRKIGFYIIDLPVTTKAACAAGRELWGYPKFVAEIPFKLQGRSFSSSVIEIDSGETIVNLSGDLGRGIPIPSIDLVLYSFLNEQCQRTLVNVNSRATNAMGKSLRLRVGESAHPMADNLRSLELDGKSPSFISYTHRFQSRLNLGVSITSNQ